MPIDVSAWEKNPDGSFVLAHVTAHQCIPLDGNGVGLLLQFVRQTEPTANSTLKIESLQVVFPTSRARKIGTQLRLLADALDRESPPEKPKVN